MMSTVAAKGPTVGHVITVRIIVPDQYQLPATRHGRHVSANGRRELEEVCDYMRTRSSGAGLTVATLEDDIVAAARKTANKMATAMATSSDLDPQDIVAVENHPFSVVNGKLMGHEEAEKERGPIDLSWSRQDVLIWVSDRAFKVRMRQVSGAVSAVSDDPFRCDASFRDHPFYRTDYPFEAQQSVGHDGRPIFRVAAGPIRSDAVDRRYKATFLIGTHEVDPDLITVP
jgi:hypothetical protein